MAWWPSKVSLLLTGALKSGAEMCHCWLACATCQHPWRSAIEAELLLIWGLKQTKHLAGRELKSPMPVQ